MSTYLTYLPGKLCNHSRRVSNYYHVLPIPSIISIRLTLYTYI